MRRNTPNEKVLRAISIGLAAMIAIQPVMATPVFADDIDDNNNKKYDEEGKESEIANESRAEVNEAKDCAETVVKDVTQNVVAGEVTSWETSTSENGDIKVDVVDYSTPIIEAVSGVNEAFEDVAKSLEDTDEALTTANDIKEALSSFDGIADEVDPEAKAAIDAIKEAEAAIIVKTEANKAIEEAVKNGDAKVEEAIEQYTIGVSVVDDASKIVTKAEENYSELVNDITNATTIEDAEQAYAELESMLKDTQETIDKKQEVLNAAKVALSNLADEIEAYEIDVNKAEEQFDEAQKKYKDAENKYSTAINNYSIRVQYINQYKEAYENAKEKLDDAKENLKLVSDKAEELSNAVDAANNAIEASKIADRAKEISNQIGNEIIKPGAKEEGAFWKQMNELFRVIMENYYLPEVLHATDYTMEWNNDINSTLYKKDTVDRPFSNNSDYNYCLVSYTDVNGNKVEKYFNYKRRDGEDKANNKITIFEKSEEEILANRVLNAGKNNKGYEYKIGDVTYASADELKKTVIQNKNFKENNMTLVQSGDEGFINFLNLNSKYERLSEEIKAEREAISKASDTVKELGEIVDDFSKLSNGKKIPTETISIGELPKNVDINPSKIKSIIEELIANGADFGGKDIADITIADVKSVLEAEQKKLDELNEKVKTLTESMDSVVEQLTTTIDRLTPETEQTNQGTTFGSELTNNAEDSNDIVGTVATPTIVTPISVAETTPAIATELSAIGSDETAGVAGARITRAGGNTGDKVIDETTGGILEGTDEKLQGTLPVVAEDEVKEQTSKKIVKTIKDEEIPLASFDEEATKKISWWWLLIIALLGATGEEMYRRHKKKKEELASVKTEINDKN